MKKKIIIISYIVAIIGLSLELAAIFTYQENVQRVIMGIKNWTSCMGLSFLGLDIFNYRNFSSYLTLNYINLAVFVLMLTGVILYQTSNQKETRLLRFVIMIVFISNSVIMLTSLVTPFYYLQYIKEQPTFWIFWAIGRVIQFCWIFITYKGLKYIESTKSHEIEFGLDEVGSTVPVNTASRSQRFLHLIVDLFISIVVISPMVQIFGQNSLEFMESHLGERGFLYIFLLVFRLVYYPFCEIIFGTTPAKLLTETFVVDYTGKKPDAGIIFLRTFTRFIPFEPFSFFGAKGWHDSITQTQVCTEARTGVKGRWYLLIFPVFLMIGLGSYFGHEWYEDYTYRQSRIKEHKQKIEVIENDLMHLTTDDVIHIEDVDNRYSSEELYLKVEEINKDELLVAILQKQRDYSSSLYAVEKIYNANKNYLSTIPVKLADLKKAYTPDYDQSNSEKRNTANLLMDGRKFEIVSIDRLFCPSIKDRNTGGCGENINLELLDAGWPANIIELTNLEGNIRWGNELPERIETLKGSDYPSFSLYGSNYKQGSHYKIRMVLLDTLNRKHTYIIEGEDLQKTISKIQ